MTPASQIRQMYERVSDENRRKAIMGAWNRIQIFFRRLEQSGSFWDKVGVSSNDDSFIVGPENNPIFKGYLRFLKRTGKSDRLNASTLGSFSVLTNGTPAITMSIPDEGFSDDFPIHPTKWLDKAEETFFHEYTHYLDWQQIGTDKFNKLPRPTDLKGYHNTSHEMNAFWSQWRNAVWAKLNSMRDTPFVKRAKQIIFDSKIGKDVNDFVSRLNREDFFRALDPANKKRIIKRAYAYWDMVLGEFEKIKASAPDTVPVGENDESCSPLDAQNYDEFIHRLRNMTDPKERQKLLTYAEEENKRHHAKLLGTDNPQLLYHGSPHKEIKQDGFKLTKGKRSGFLGSERQVDNQGVFMTDSLNLAHHFGSNRAKAGEGYEIYKAYANLDSTLDLTKKVPKNLTKLGLHMMYPNDYTGPRPKGITQSDLWQLLDEPMFVQAIKDMGYTAVKFKEDMIQRKGAGDKSANTIMVLDPKHLSVTPHNDKIKTTDDLWKHIWSQRAHNQVPQQQGEAMRSIEQGRFMFLRICRQLKESFPEASKIDFTVVPDKARANDGIRNFNARCVSEGGSCRIEVKESVLRLMPTDEFVDLIKHELAHAYVRLRRIGEKHDKNWEKVFKKFGGSGQRSPYCAD